MNKGELTTEYRGDGRHCIIVRPLPACFRGWSVLCDVMSGLGGIWYLCYAGDLAVAGGSCYKAVLSCLFLFFFLEPSALSPIHRSIDQRHTEIHSEQRISSNHKDDGRDLEAVHDCIGQLSNRK